MGELPYSYHTFIFPFIWNDNGNVSAEEFIKVLNPKHWFEISWKSENIKTTNKEDYFLDYAAFQYFTKPACNMIFNTRDDNVVRNFEFRYNGISIREKGYFFISKAKEKFELKINGIELKLFNTGVAVLSFELEYSGVKFVQGEKENSKTFDDLNKINEFG